MKKHLLFGLLLSGLAGCRPHTWRGPDGCQVTKPIKYEHTITYTVSGFQPENTAMKKFVEQIAYTSLSEDDEVGDYTIRFSDQRTNSTIFSTHGHIHIDDLFRTHKITYDYYEY